MRAVMSAPVRTSNQIWPAAVHAWPPMARAASANAQSPAPQGDLDGLVDALTVMLERIDYFRPESRRTTTLRNVRQLVTKPGWSAKEVQMMRGILTGIERGPRQP